MPSANTAKLKSASRICLMGLLDPGGTSLVDDLAPFVDLAFDETGKLIQSSRFGRDQPHVEQLLLYLGTRHMARNFVVQLVDDGARRPGGRYQHLPGS